MSDPYRKTYWVEHPDGGGHWASNWEIGHEREPNCAACCGDPEAHGLHVCGKEPFA